MLELQRKGISTPILEAMYRVPRHFFFTPDFDHQAYQDKAFPIPGGQTISQPYTVARQTELLEVTAGDHVLEIGTGSGYQCAVLCALGCRVTSIEIVPVLHQMSSQLLHHLGYAPALLLGDGSKGYAQHGPYKGIIVTAGAPVLPHALLDQLAPSGKLVIPVGAGAQQQMMRYTLLPDGRILEENFGTYSFVPLVSGS